MTEEQKPPPPPLPPSTQDLLARIAAHEDWTKKQVEDIMTKLSSLPPAEQKKKVEEIKEKVSAGAVDKESRDVWDDIFGA